MFKKRDKCNSVKEVVERNTGISSEEFLKDVVVSHLHNLDETAEFIKSFITKYPHAIIRIVGDYDVDGDTSTSILYFMFLALGFEAKTRIPRRFSEGYGLSEKIVDEMPAVSEGEALLITCDNGISSYDAIAKAKKKGYVVVVTDHHLPPRDVNGNMILPPADIILNPHIEPEKSDFCEICGATVAYRLAEKLLPDKNLIQLLVLASIGTVCDVMPLVNYNRTLVKKGLEAINQRKVVAGLNAVLTKENFDNHINEEDFGFTIGPIFNAAGRLYDNGAEKVVELLKGKSDNLAKMAENLHGINDIRKSFVREAMERVKKAYPTGIPHKPTVWYDPETKEGIIGIVAGQITEKYAVPSIVFTDTEDEGVLKGSGRCIPEIHLKETLDKIQDLILGYGGHAGAAGLAIKKENLEAFTKAFQDACGDLPELTDEVFYDLELDGSNMKQIADDINIYGPFGEGNPKPILHCRFNLSKGEFKKIGGDKTHFMVKYPNFTIMGFGLVEKYENLDKPSDIECIGYLKENWFNGKMSYQFQISDFEPISA